VTHSGAQNADQPECLDEYHSSKVTETHKCFQYSNVEIMSTKFNKT